MAFSNWAVLRSQQFTNGHFHLSLWNWCPPSNVASVFPNHFLHSCFVHICPWCAEVAGAMMMMMIISSLMPILKPYSFFWHSALLCLYQYGIAILWGSILHLSRSHHTTKLFAGPSFRCSWYCTSCYMWISSYWLMWWQLLRVPPTSTTFYWKIKYLINIQVTGLETLPVGYVLYLLVIFCLLY